MKVGQRVTLVSHCGSVTLPGMVTGVEKVPGYAPIFIVHYRSGTVRHMERFELKKGRYVPADDDDLWREMILR